MHYSYVILNVRISLKEVCLKRLMAYKVDGAKNLHLQDIIVDIGKKLER